MIPQYIYNIFFTSYFLGFLALLNYLSVGGSSRKAWSESSRAGWFWNNVVSIAEIAFVTHMVVIIWR